MKKTVVINECICIIYACICAWIPACVCVCVHLNVYMSVDKVIIFYFFYSVLSFHYIFQSICCLCDISICQSVHLPYDPCWSCAWLSSRWATQSGIETRHESEVWHTLDHTAAFTQFVIQTRHESEVWHTLDHRAAFTQSVIRIRHESEVWHNNCSKCVICLQWCLQIKCF